ncbi:phage tail termination protein [Mixta calida]
MTPQMHVRVRELFGAAGLCDNSVVQMLVWRDTGNKADRFIVFRPNGGSAIRNDLGSEYYVMVDVISPVDNFRATEEAVSDIIDYVQRFPTPNDCIGHIENIGGIPAPVLTTEGRLVWRLQFAVLYGE